MTKFTYIITLLSCLSASAQRIVPLSEMKRTMPVYSGTYIPNFESFYSTAEREEIDDIALRVIYDLTVRIDTLVRHDRIVAEPLHKFLQSVPSGTIKEPYRPEPKNFL